VLTDCRASLSLGSRQSISGQPVALLPSPG
jgi:hypothetical protein